MLKELEAQFHDGVITEAATRYGITGDQLKNHKAFESYVFAFERDGCGYILKITHTMRRSENYIMGELEFLNFLADHDVPVARAIPSAHGRLVERIDADNGEAWLVIAYEMAPGHRVTAEEWTGELFETWGQLMGKIHRLTRHYRLSTPAYKRQEWYEEDQLNARKYLPPSEAAVIARSDELMGYLQSLPRTDDAFGLLHDDLHHGNWFVDEGRITLFDFDDCGYNWYASDIAITLVGALWFPPKETEDESAFAEYFLEHFLRGYARESRLDAKWLSLIRDFLLLRDLLHFIIVYQTLDVASFTEEQHEMLDEHRRRVLEREPIVDLDWQRLAKAWA